MMEGNLCFRTSEWIKGKLGENNNNTDNCKMIILIYYWQMDGSIQQTCCSAYGQRE